MKNGNCFISAYRLAVHVNGLLVHGVPVGRGPLNRGKRYAHAWVEKDGLVLDYANDRFIRLPVTVYYRKGHMTEDHVRRYTDRQAMETSEAHGHYGPWDEALSAQEEVKQ